MILWSTIVYNANDNMLHNSEYDSDKKDDHGNSSLGLMKLYQ